MQRRRLEKDCTAGRKAWQAPRLARLRAGSAEDGSGSEEDGSFTAS
ncbi:MAG TPA: hypothetical protein VF645_11495 [Allosphingosinicella sp.]